MARTAIGPGRGPRLRGEWPADIPCFFLPMDEGSGKFNRNYGNMGNPTLALRDPATQWRFDGKFTTQAASPAEFAWTPTRPENKILLDKLFFFRECTSGSPGIGGNIALLSFRTQSSGSTSAQTRVITAGVAGINVAAAAWELNLYGDVGNIRFARKEGFGALAISNTLAALGATGTDRHVVIMLDALNKDVHLWLDGQPQTIAQTDIDTATALFKQFAITTQWDINAVDITVGNTNTYGAAIGARTGDTTNTKTMWGKPLSDVFYADITALDAVLAARRDDIASAMYESPEGYLSEAVATLMTP